MTLDNSEREYIRSLPKRLDMPPHLQAAKDKKLRAALLAALGDAALAEIAMRVVKGQR